MPFLFPKQNYIQLKDNYLAKPNFMIHNFAKNRINAFFLHLIFSAFIVFCFTLSTILIWYPDYLMSLTGAKTIFLMIIGIDVCLGPILTLIIFNKTKKKLASDLAIIFIIQLSALAYGMYTVTIARPVYIVFAVDRFELVQANEISTENLKKAKEEKFKHLPTFKLKWVSAKRPSDKKEKEKLLFESIETGLDLAQLPKYYQSYSQAIPQIIEKSIPLSSLERFNQHKLQEVKKTLSKYKDYKKYRYLPLAGKKTSLTVIIDTKSGAVIEVINLNPWS